MNEWISKLLGGKPWFRSLTAWGLVVFGVSEVFVAQACNPEVGLLSESVCGVLVKGLSLFGGALVILGLRKAATTPNKRAA